MDSATLHQQKAGCSDFDVLLGPDRVPSFRVLLPEVIHGEGVKKTGHLHVIPGKWRMRKGGASGSFAAADQFNVGVEIETGKAEIRVELTVANIGGVELANVWADICASVSHLPGNPGWSNLSFLPAVPPDRPDQGRYDQGRYWYETLTPRRLFAIGPRGWVPMHPHPDNPDANAVPRYSFSPSKEADARACAVESLKGGLWFFQGWDAPCRWCAPCHGNSCMHLEPFLAERLPAGGTAVVRGRIGVHEGDRKSLEDTLRPLW